MRFIAAVLQSSLITSALSFPSDASPFSPPLCNDVDAPYGGNDALATSEPTTAQSAEDPLELLKRQDCPTNYNSCSTLAAADAGSCCSVDSVCSLDNAGNVACCPIGSFCTGTIGTPSSPTAVVVSASIVTATTTAAPSTGAVSYVPNPYFSFPYIPSTFANSASCSAAYSTCASDYAQCTIDLQGGEGRFAVTIVAPGGGITVSAPASTNVGAASATAICSSLSNLACPGTAATCSVYAIGTASPELISAAGAPAEGRCWLSLMASLTAGAVWWLL